MGGEGSGRRPDPLKSYQNQHTPIAQGNLMGDFYIPDYSGVSKHAPTLAELDKRYQPIGSAGTEQDPIFIATSGAFLKSYTETDPIYIATSGAFLKSYTETDPIFIATSGAFLKTETDPVFLALSGAFLTSYTETDPIFTATSGAFLLINGTRAMTGDLNMGSQDIKAVASVEVNTTGKLQLRDGEIYINSNADGEMTIEADTKINITANTEVTGTMKTLTDLDASGAGIFRNIIIDSTSGGYTASNFTQGSILMVYA